VHGRTTAAAEAVSAYRVRYHAEPAADIAGSIAYRGDLAGDGASSLERTECTVGTAASSTGRTVGMRVRCSRVFGSPEHRTFAPIVGLTVGGDAPYRQAGR
jgi:hypothetical protein